MILNKSKEKKLLEVLRLFLYSDDVNLRDKTVTLLSILEIEGSYEVLKEYLPSEKVGWLNEYACSIVENLKKDNNNTRVVDIRRQNVLGRRK